ncbi:hypothetical protein [Psychrobacter glaciei]|uniref:hypothetical protein n=1 Tax=Psychrobacter TaxID=497 RepID=UPI001F05A5E8|nr:hypothetical protein [Psychrobacter glaciei]MCH1781636.1 hypothetical protein [Psychrobacter glaciei]
MKIWGYRLIADKLAEDPSNFKQGCMYYESTFIDKKINMKILTVSIDGYKSEHIHIFANSFPSNKNWKGKTYKRFIDYIEAHRRDCHPVEYIEFPLLIGREIYIYNYLGDFGNTISSSDTTDSTFNTTKD